MARAITTVASLPAEEQASGRLIEDSGFTSWYYLDYKDLPPEGQYIQVRDTKFLAPPMEVAKYHLAYANGDILPAIIVTEDGFLVDGNTRRAGAMKAGLTGLPTFVLRLNYTEAPEPVRKRLVMLATRANQINGRQMTRQNVEAIIRYVADDEDTPKTLAAKLNCSPATVAGVLALRRGMNRAERLEVERGSLTLSHLKVLGQKEPKLNDPVFVALMMLVRDARMSVKEMGEICSRLEHLPTDKAKLDLLADERRLATDRIRGIADRPSAAGVVRRALGGIRKHSEAPDRAVEENPELVGRYLAELYETQAVIGKIIAAQSAVEHSRTNVRFTPPVAEVATETVEA